MDLDADLMTVVRAVALIGLLGLSGCGRGAQPPLNESAPPPVDKAATAQQGAASGTSVPDAGIALSEQDAIATRSKGTPPTTMTQAKESAAMPLPGQANDHSGAVRDDKTTKK